MERTVTRDQDVFSLPLPASARIEFLEQDQVKYHIPSDSTFKIPWHWHNTPDDGCRQISCESGTLLISYAMTALGSGTSTLTEGSLYEFKPDQRHAWGPEMKNKATLIVILTIGDSKLLRNVYSAILDTDRFPSLASTPYWLKFLLQSLKIWPAARSLLISKLLFVQTQAMHYHYGYHEHHGAPDFIQAWRLTHPFDTSVPDRVKQLQRDSSTVISNVVQAACYYGGRLFFGMRGSYDQYTPN